MNSYSQKLGVISISAIKGIGAAFVKKNLTKNSFTGSNIEDEIASILKLNNRDADEHLIGACIQEGEKIMEQCQDFNIKIISIISDDYPEKLKELKDPPPLLYCKGNLEILHQKAIAIIGTRQPNLNGEIIAERTGLFYSSSNWVICNGLADGIDSRSIKSAEKIYSKVLGIVAGGLNYNERKTLLKVTATNAEAVLENGGLIVSENPPDKKEDTFSVVKSCRIQAGLSDAIILIQSSIDGGSKFTLKPACEMGRPVGVIQPVNADSGLPSYGANKLLIEKGNSGLSLMTELKTEKILTKNIFIIRNREDYASFEKIISKEDTTNKKINPTLF